MFSQLTKTLNTNFINLKGWKTKRKLIVIESDDWGSIRVSPNKSLENIFNVSYLDSYNRYDALESNEDLTSLFDTLLSIKDGKGNHPRITINNIVANPDFEKIKKFKFESYFYESFTETLQRYPNTSNVKSLYLQGIKEKLVIPQFHGREHLNVNKWMKSLQSKDPLMLKLFDNNMFTINTPNKSSCKAQFLDAFGTYSNEDIEFLDTAITDGVKIFKDIWGLSPISVVSPCHIWDSSTEKVFLKNNLIYIQSGQKQTFSSPHPKFGDKKRHYIGEKNELGQLFTIRNVIFEPSINKSKNLIKDCIDDIETAFFWKKPAIISTHRLNYIGSINKNNRFQNLESLKILLTEILKKWPEVEFIDTIELGNEISKAK